MRVALIGTGSAGHRGHLPALLRLHKQGRLTLVATADRNSPPRGAITAEAHTFRDGAHMLDSVETDLVVIATEPSRHAELISLATAHGCGVLCEKPLAVTAADHQQLIVASQNAAALVAVHQYRYSPAWQRIQRWTRMAARANTPIRINIHVRRAGTDQHAASTWRRDVARQGGALADHGPHFLALAWTLSQRLRPEGSRIDRHPDGTESATAACHAGPVHMTLRVTTAAAKRSTSLDLSAPGVRLTWVDSDLALTFARTLTQRCSAPALSDRAHVDALYLPLYQDLLANIHDAKWRLQRRREALAVNTTLLGLLDGAQPEQ